MSIEKVSRSEKKIQDLINLILLPALDNEDIPQTIIDKIKEDKHDYDSFMAYTLQSSAEVFANLCNIGFASGDALKIYKRICALNENSKTYPKAEDLIGKTEADDIKRFFEALRDPIIDKKNRTLKFKLGDSSHNEQCEFNVPSFRLNKMRGVFIRKSYLELFERLFNNKKDDTHAILNGNPGTGKTSFGYYAMHRLMRENRSFFYEPANNGVVWMFSGEQTRQEFKKENDNVARELECIKVSKIINYKKFKDHFVHIIDGHAPPQVLPFRVVLICSPREKHYAELRKDMCGSSMFYMPTWDYGEIENCRTMFFHSIPKSLVQKLFERWGGIARDVLNQPQAIYASKSSESEVLEKAMQDINEAIRKCNWASEEDFRIYHIKVSNNYSFISTRFASDFIRHLVFDTIKKSNESKNLCEMLCMFIEEKTKTAIENKEAKQHRMSELLEELCADIICSGIRNMNKLQLNCDSGIGIDQTCYVDLPPLIRYWSRLSSSKHLKSILTEIKTSSRCQTYRDKGILFRSCENHPTFDFLSIRFDSRLVVTDAVFFNMTSSETHNLNINARFINYVRLLLSLNQKVTLEFCYVTSDNNFWNFNYFQYPADHNELDQKLKQGASESERNSFSEWEQAFKSKFKITKLLVSKDKIKANLLN